MLMLSRRFHLGHALAIGAVLVDAALQRWPDALPGHLDQAELRDFQDLGAGAIALDGVAHRFLDGAAMLVVAHVDEVVDDDAAEVAEPELAGDFLGGLQVHLERRFLGVVVGAEVAAVDVDGHQRFGLLDDDRAAVGQRDLALLDLGDFLLDAVWWNSGSLPS